MVRDLVFHLGDCKTGSTSIQTVLARGDWRAADRRLYYPPGFNQIPLARALIGTPADADRQWATLARRLETARGDTGIVSAEHFEFVDPDRFADMLTRHLGAWSGRVRLVAYVRPHAERFLSSFAESCKLGGFGQAMPEFLDRMERTGRLHYAPRFARWRARFGDALTVRPFVRDRLAGGDVVRDFFDLVLEGGAVTLTGPTHQNESLSVEDLTLLRAVHERLKARPGPAASAARESLGRNFGRVLAALPAPAGTTRLRLDRALAGRIAAIYAEDARAMDAGFFAGPVLADRLAAAVEGAAEQPQSLDPADYHDARALRQATAWASFLGEVLAADPEHFAWAARPADFRPAAPKARRGAPDAAAPAAVPAMAPLLERSAPVLERVAALLPPPVERRLRRAWRQLRRR